MIDTVGKAVTGTFAAEMIERAPADSATRKRVPGLGVRAHGTLAFASSDLQLTSIYLLIGPDHGSTGCVSTIKTPGGMNEID
jgi:hypothetical protein